MASLLAKFRIDYSDLQLIPDITNKPQDSTFQFFDDLIKDFLSDTENSGEFDFREYGELTLTFLITIQNL